MAEGKGRHEGDNMSASGLGPFRYSSYRTLWIAVMFSYVGAAMYDIGASWLMISHSKSFICFSDYDGNYSAYFSI